MRKLRERLAKWAEWSWFIVDDPDLQYSNLDKMDGLQFCKGCASAIHGTEHHDRKEELT